MFRRAAFIATALLSGAAVAQAPNRQPYDIAILCFVANVAAAGERRDAGDTEGVATYEEKAELAYGAALQLGDVLGFTSEQIERDFDAMQDRELPKMVGDMDYLLRAAGTCKAYGLM